MRISEKIINEHLELNPIIVTPEMEEKGKIAYEKILYQKRLKSWIRLFKKIIKLSENHDCDIKNLLKIKEVKDVCFKYPELHIFLKEQTN